MHDEFGEHLTRDHQRPETEETKKERAFWQQTLTVIWVWCTQG